MRFKPLTLQDAPLLRPYLAHSKYIDMGFCALFYVAEEMQVRYALVQNCLLLQMRYEQGDVFCHPLGERVDIAGILRELQLYDASFDFVPEEALSLYTQAGGETVSYDAKYDDYYITREDFFNLQGSVAEKKRKDYQYFVQHFADRVTLSEMTPQHFERVRAIFSAWCAGRDCAQCGYGCERENVERLLTHWDALPLKGLLMDLDGAPAGFRIAEQNGATILPLCAKPIREERGLSLYLLMEMIRCFTEFDGVNLGADLGVEGLRRFKGKFKPHALLRKYMVRMER